MTLDPTTTSRLADDMRALADEVDKAGAEALADADIWSAMQHLMESLEAAERSTHRLIVDALKTVADGP